MTHNLTLFGCLLVTLFRLCQGCTHVVQAMTPATLECTFPENVTSVSWLFELTHNRSVNLADCSFESNKCSNPLPLLYYANSSNSNGVNRTSLLIKSISSNMTTFACVANNGLRGHPCTLDVYAWPTRVMCISNVTETCVDISCYIGNVYPGFNAVLTRKEMNLTSDDFIDQTPKCTLSPYGAGYDNDYAGSCVWRIPMNRMLAESTFIVAVTANVSYQSVLNSTSPIEESVHVSLPVPQLVVNRFTCPVGSGVLGQSILIGGNATCKCELTSRPFPGAQARWYTTYNRIVGAENKQNGSSTLTLTYNASDPNQGYECRLVVPFAVNVSGIPFTPTFTSRNCLMGREKGKPQSIDLVVPNNVSTFTWQLINGGTRVNISSCSFVTNTCSDENLSLYQAEVYSFGGEQDAVLNLVSPRTHETQFAIITDTGLRIDYCPLEVYAFPKKPVCVDKLTLTKDYVEYTCTTANVYPQAYAILRRRENGWITELAADTFAPGYPQCTFGPGSEGDYSQTCVWRIPMSMMIPLSYISVEMGIKVVNTSSVSSRAAYSDDIITSLSVPVAVLGDCHLRLADSVQVIPRGRTATCDCKLISVGFPPPSIRWYDKHNNTVGGNYFNTAVLNVSYEASDPFQSYECRPSTTFKSGALPVKFTPQFSSSAGAIPIKPLIIVLGAVCAGVISRVQSTR